ncbi:aldo/keto reductase [Moheibacter lacus]|uniref:Aldo/keto reductase n=1 Tax=Moheibacter lacus TaxID=2745851 RepID=A0A838ZN02_9FLAO|nr:aldo/keto reductase [Moheibacter lacus]MBA5629240.1 aldo/keto reductase [Moheibacter lacus]
MINLENLSKIGIGTYRMSIENNNHREALEYAIDNGINLIDTASNYQNGNSEKLIGKLIDSSLRENVFIITKAGYIQGDDINKLSSINKNKIVHINERFYYSIDKSFIELQIKQSLERINTEYIDCFLIHNPEHYFDVPNEIQKDIDQHIIETFQYLEGLVNTGIIRYYGISSNHLPDPSLKNFGFENLLKLRNQFPHFKIVQFPFNLVESNASLKLYNSNSLIDVCKQYDIKCISNRPFNTIYEGKTLQLIDHSFELNNINEEKEIELFHKMLNLVQNRLHEIGENTPIEEFTPIKYLIKNRKLIANEAALNEVIRRYLFPFLNQIELADENTFKIISLLQNEWRLFIKQNNKLRLTSLKEKMGINENEDLMKYLYDLYLTQGVDHVLMGLRNKKYVDNILHLL